MNLQYAGKCPKLSGLFFFCIGSTVRKHHMSCFTHIRTIRLDICSTHTMIFKQLVYIPNEFSVYIYIYTSDQEGKQILVGKARKNNPNIFQTNC